MGGFSGLSMYTARTPAAVATRTGPSTKPNIPNRPTPPTTLMKITNPLNSVRPPSNSGRKRLSTIADTPAQITNRRMAPPHWHQRTEGHGHTPEKWRGQLHQRKAKTADCSLNGREDKACGHTRGNKV